MSNIKQIYTIMKLQYKVYIDYFLPHKRWFKKKR